MGGYIIKSIKNYIKKQADSRNNNIVNLYRHNDKSESKPLQAPFGENYRDYRRNTAAKVRNSHNRLENKTKFE